MRFALAILSLLLAPAAAQAPKLDDVVARMGRYIDDYESQFASVVAEETYRQNVHHDSGRVETRTLRSDYALTRAADGHEWIGYRDTFEVDGTPVRDREERLQRLLSSGAIAEAEQVMKQNSRFNLADDLLSRNVNVPTFAVEILHPRNKERFSHRRLGVEVANGVVLWNVEFRERERPTLVRTPGGGNQPTRVLALIDPSNGEVVRTTSTWQDVRGSVVVTYGRVPALPVLVPLTMTEEFIVRDGTRIEGTATYANYRRFETSGRLLEPR